MSGHVQDSHEVWKTMSGRVQDSQEVAADRVIVSTDPTTRRTGVLPNPVIHAHTQAGSRKAINVPNILLTHTQDYRF